MATNKNNKRQTKNTATQTTQSAQPVKIFPPMGGVAVSTLSTNNIAFITLSEAGGDNIALGYAPVTGVSIQQLTDFSVTKSLSRDFLIAAFGDTPVKITLSGVDFFNINGCNILDSKTGAGSNDQIMDFYRKNRISTDRTKRFDIAIATSDKNTVGFRCVITGLDAQNKASSDGLNNVMYNYTMFLIGVDR